MLKGNSRCDSLIDWTFSNTHPAIVPDMGGSLRVTTRRSHKFLCLMRIVFPCQFPADLVGRSGSHMIKYFLSLPRSNFILETLLEDDVEGNPIHLNFYIHVYLVELRPPQSLGTCFATTTLVSVFLPVLRLSPPVLGTYGIQVDDWRCSISNYHTIQSLYISSFLQYYFSMSHL